MNSLFASIYEILFDSRDFSNQMYGNGLYSICAIIMLITPLLVSAVFYFLINSPKYNKLKHWLITLVVVYVLTFVMTYIFVNSKLSNTGYDFSHGEYATFAFWNGVLSIILFFIYSLICRTKSSNCSKTPSLKLR